MVFDILEKLETYIPLIPKIRVVADSMDHDDIYSLDRGKYKTYDPSVTYEVSQYVTSTADLPFEFHKKTTIVQIVLSGSELVSSTWRELKDESTNYNEKNDIGFFVAEPLSVIQASQGRFVVFLPGEPFKSAVAMGTGENVKKVTFFINEG